MDNFDLKKYLAEGKLHKNVNQDEKSQLMDFVKNLQDVFSSGDIQYPIFVDSLDPELYDDGSDLIKNFVKYLSYKYSYDEVTPLELDGGDVEDFLRSKFNEINEGDHSLDMVLNEMVNEEQVGDYDDSKFTLTRDQEEIEDNFLTYWKLQQCTETAPGKWSVLFNYAFDGEGEQPYNIDVEADSYDEAAHKAYVYTLDYLS